MIEGLYRNRKGQLLVCVDSEQTSGRYVEIDDNQENRQLIIDATYKSMAAIFMVLNLYGIPLEQFLEDPKIDDEVKKFMERINNGYLGSKKRL
jgi:hypothetical protein